MIYLNSNSIFAKKVFFQIRYQKNSFQLSLTTPGIFKRMPPNSQKSSGGEDTIYSLFGQIYNYLKMSSETLKQLKIKTSTVKRLKKEFISYDKQTKSITKKLQDLEAQPDTQDRQIEVKKQNQFLSESESVLSNVKQKLIESFEALAQFLSEKQNEEGLEGTEEKKQAEEVVLDVETFLENITW